MYTIKLILKPLFTNNYDNIYLSSVKTLDNFYKDLYLLNLLCIKKYNDMKKEYDEKILSSQMSKYNCKIDECHIKINGYIEVYVNNKNIIDIINNDYDKIYNIKINRVYFIKNKINMNIFYKNICKLFYLDINKLILCNRIKTIQDVKKKWKHVQYGKYLISRFELFLDDEAQEYHNYLKLHYKKI